MCVHFFGRSVYVLAIYRMQTGDLEEFMGKLDCVINYRYIPTAEFIIYGDINTDFLTEVTINNARLP